MYQSSNKEEVKFLGTLDYGEIKHHYKKKKKEKQDLCAQIDFNADEFTQYKNEDTELFIATSDYDETKFKHHKTKKKDKLKLFEKVHIDCNNVEFTQQKKKEKQKPDLHAKPYTHCHKDEQDCEKEKATLLIETYADYDTTKRNYHKKKKKKDLLVETCIEFNEKEPKQHKKKQKTSEMFIETSADFNENVFNQHKKKKKKEKPELLTETSSLFNKYEPEQHKKKEEKIELLKQHKKKQKTSEMFAETSADFNENVLNQHKKKKKEKSELLTETSSGFNKYEPEQHKKKEKKIESPNLSLKKFQSEENTGLNLLHSKTCTEPEINFGLVHKHKKKHKEKHVSKMQIFDTIDEGEIPFQAQKKDKITACVNEANIYNEDQKSAYNKKRKKLEKYTDNSYISESLKRTDFMFQNQNTEKCQMSAAEVNNDYYEFHINYRDHHKNKKGLSITEASAIIDEHEVFSKSHKKRKKHSDENSTNFTDKDLQNSAEIRDSPYVEDIDIIDCTDRNSTNFTDKNLQNSAGIRNSPCVKDVDIIDCTDKELQNFAGIINTPCVEIIEHTNFSSGVNCNEDPVDFEIPPLHKFETVCRLTVSQKDDLLASGVFIKTGKFTTAEDIIIQRNFEHFVKNYGVSDPFSLLGIGRYQKDPELFRFLKAKHFYVRLAKDLNDRSLHSVYKRARMILHPYRKSGKLTEEEIERLKRMQENLSGKWQKIGGSLGNTAEKCAESYRWHEKNIAKGLFSKEEETKLIEALKKVSGSSDISCKNMKNISWETVASYLPTRNGSQCRMYWAYYLAWAPGSAKKEWDHSCYCKLVHILKEMDFENSSEIDWRKVYKSFEDFAPSDLYVQKRWLYMRSRVPDYKNKNHTDIVNILCDKYSL